MIIIRNQQMGALTADARMRFAARMKSRIVEEYPQNYAQLGEAGTAKLILKGIADGERLQLGGEDTVGILIELMVEFGEDFQRTPDQPWIANMLGLAGVPGEVRMIAVCKRIQKVTGGRRMVVSAKSNSS